ncbi:MAG TPA: hypothetical protein PLD25_07505 [Chloroflexota bacterium]|nr:hypothetical protein [Chloroflexota bacterium]HUM68520.1 hypothetical protein [Chloroflexota bacterium]
MTLSEQTLTRIQSLAYLYKTGYHSETVDSTIAKLVTMEHSRLEQESATLAERLQFFEQQYNLPSADFYQKFQNGELGDDADLFEWSAFYQMWLSIQARLQTLQSKPE